MDQKFSLSVTDDCDRVVERVNSLNIPPDDLLHGFQAAVDFLYSGRFHRLHHKNGHFLMIDRIAS